VLTDFYPSGSQAPPTTVHHVSATTKIFTI
jgi:hypothetical protein